MHREATLSELEQIVTKRRDSKAGAVSKLNQLYNAFSDEQKVLFAYETISMPHELYKQVNEINSISLTLLDSSKLDEVSREYISTICETSETLKLDLEKYHRQDKHSRFASYFSMFRDSKKDDAIQKDTLWGLFKRRRLRKKLYKLSKEGQQEFLMCNVYPSIVHDIRNPTTVIGISAKRVLKRLDKISSGYNKIAIIIDKTQNIEMGVDRKYDHTCQSSQDISYCNLSHIIEDVATYILSNSKKRYINLYNEKGFPRIRSKSDMLKTGLNLLFIKIRSNDGDAQLEITPEKGNEKEVKLRMFNKYIKPEVVQPPELQQNKYPYNLDLQFRRAAKYLSMLGGRFEAVPCEQGTEINLYLPRDLDTVRPLTQHSLRQ